MSLECSHLFSAKYLQHVYLSVLDLANPSRGYFLCIRRTPKCLNHNSIIEILSQYSMRIDTLLIT